MTDQAKEFGECEVATSGEVPWRYSAPFNKESKSLLLTTGKVAIVGSWGTGIGVIAWCPLPKRNKQQEEELGL